MEPGWLDEIEPVTDPPFVRMATRALGNGDWLLDGDDVPAQLAEKHRILTTHHHDAVAALAGTHAAATELLEAVRRHLAARPSPSPGDPARQVLGPARPPEAAPTARRGPDIDLAGRPRPAHPPLATEPERWSSRAASLGADRGSPPAPWSDDPRLARRPASAKPDPSRPGEAGRLAPPGTHDPTPPAPNAGPLAAGLPIGASPHDPTPPAPNAAQAGPEAAALPISAGLHDRTPPAPNAGLLAAGLPIRAGPHVPARPAPDAGSGAGTHDPGLPAPEGGSVGGELHPIDVAGRLVAEDLCLLVPRDGRWVLGAGSVCFPSHWRLTEKLGLPLAAVHEPVPDYAAELADRVDRFLDKLRAGRGVVRRNWTVHTEPDLHAPDVPPPPDPPVTAADAGQRLWLRSERQTLTRLPRTGAIVFTIRTQQVRLGAVATRPDLRARLARAVAAWPPHQTGYRGGEAVRAPLLAWLRLGDR